MSVTIDLPVELEQGLTALAMERGVSLPEYVTALLTDRLQRATPASPLLRAQMWREAARNVPHSPPLSDEAASKESIYGGRG